MIERDANGKRVYPRRTAVSLFTITNGPGQVTGASQSRVGIGFVHTDNGNTTYNPDRDTTVGNGIQLNIHSPGITWIMRETHGDIVTHPWFGRTDGGTFVIPVYEVFDD